MDFEFSGPDSSQLAFDLKANVTKSYQKFAQAQKAIYGNDAVYGNHFALPCGPQNLGICSIMYLECR